MTAAKKLKAPRERPIILTATSVLAILSGRKTQIRCVVEPQPMPGMFYGGLNTQARPMWSRRAVRPGDDGFYELGPRCPRGAVGDRLWVKEAWARPNLEEVLYRATNQRPLGKCKPDPMYPQWPWRMARSMPRSASRLTLELVDVGVERLQDISEEDAKAEGVEQTTSIGPLRVMGWRDYSGGRGFMRPHNSFQTLWDSAEGDRKNGPKWDENPWVWVIQFKRARP